MTEGLIVFSTFIAGVLMTDPFYAGGLTKSAFAKGLVYALGFGALGFHCLGRAATAPERFGPALREVVAAWWPLIALSLFVIAGSTYGRAVDGVKESFLNVGVGMLFLPLFALALRSSEEPFRAMKWLAAVYVLMVLSSVPILAANIHDFHESIFLMIPASAYLLVGRRFSWWRAALALALLGACLFSFKNTTFLLVLATLAGCLLVWLVRLMRFQNRLAVVLGVIVVVPLLLAAVAAVVYQGYANREVLPSGNVEYRTEMYRIAWNLFTKSPVWGTAFTDASVVYFQLYKVQQDTQYLPTHSDVLDLLAHGGVIAVVLWLIYTWRVLKIIAYSGRVLAQDVSDADLRPNQWLFVLALIQVGAVITYAINPVMISPVYAYWMWGSGGLMWALYMELAGAKLPVRLTRHALTQQTLNA